MFELATSEEIDKLARSRASSSEEGRFTDEIYIDEVHKLQTNRELIINL